MEELTGQTLGDQVREGFGSGGLGGAGSGYGQGAGGLGGRRSHGLDPGSARWLPPVRTDKRGRVRLLIPLGDAETTWQVVLVAIPDQATPAVTSVDLTTVLPLSVRVATGASWTVGDTVNVPVRVRNRTDKALITTLRLDVAGAAQLLEVTASRRTLSVPAQSTVTVGARLRGSQSGAATLEARVAATVEGAPLVDRLSHTWTVHPQGKPSRRNMPSGWTRRRRCRCPPPRKPCPRGARAVSCSKGDAPHAGGGRGFLAPRTTDR